MKFFTPILARRIAGQTKARFESVVNAVPEPLARLAATLTLTYGGAEFRLIDDESQEKCHD